MVDSRQLVIASPLSDDTMSGNTRGVSNTYANASKPAPSMAEASPSQQDALNAAAAHFMVRHGFFTRCCPKDAEGGDTFGC